MVVALYLLFTLLNVVEEVTSHVGEEIGVLFNDRRWISLRADLAQTFRNHSLAKVDVISELSNGKEQITEILCSFADCCELLRRLLVVDLGDYFRVRVEPLVQT